MTSFAERITALEKEGYTNATAMARLAHDVVLKTQVCGNGISGMYAHKCLAFSIR